MSAHWTDKPQTTERQLSQDCLVLSRPFKRTHREWLISRNLQLNESEMCSVDNTAGGKRCTKCANRSDSLRSNRLSCRSSYRSYLRCVHAGKASTYLSSGSGSTRCRRSGEETGQASRCHFPPSTYSPQAGVHAETREKRLTSPGAHVAPDEP